jgi:hypothetical protein
MTDMINAAAWVSVGAGVVVLALMVVDRQQVVAVWVVACLVAFLLGVQASVVSDPGEV